MSNTTPKRLDENKAFGMFMASIGLTMLALFVGISIGVNARNTQLVKENVVERGRALFRQIVLTRRWAASYGGVYVYKTDGVESNPWLEHPDIQAADQSILTLRNPALITREISELASGSEGYRFRITSLKPLNPGNAPDSFEEATLRSFEDKQLAERWDTIETPEGREFRYMGALATEQSCLECHAKQGYQLGDVRGGISVSFPVETLEQEISRGRIIILMASIVALGLTMALVVSMVSSLRSKLGTARAELVRMAMTDELTGLYNRRYGMERLIQEVERTERLGLSMSVALMDADNFKRLNDTQGHVAGDRTLKTLAVILASSLRPYDILMRYGGEEFVVVLPGTTLQNAAEACERVRYAVEASKDAGVTVSIGVASLCGQKTQNHDSAAMAEAILKKADSAMYRAKSAGKNQVLCDES